MTNINPDNIASIKEFTKNELVKAISTFIRNYQNIFTVDEIVAKLDDGSWINTLAINTVNKSKLTNPE